jgi:hypothetical protein
VDCGVNGRSDAAFEIASTSPILSNQIPASVPDPISVPQSTGSGGVETVDEEEEIERQLQREMIYLVMMAVMVVVVRDVVRHLLVYPHFLFAPLV